jgi:hypothetical protein
MSMELVLESIDDSRVSIKSNDESRQVVLMSMELVLESIDDSLSSMLSSRSEIPSNFERRASKRYVFSVASTQ